MKEVKFYKYIILGLVILNTVILTFFLLTKSYPESRPSPKSIQAEIIEMLSLDNEQASTFRKLANEHGHRMMEIDRQQETLLLSYFGSLNDTSNSTNKDDLLKQFQQLERVKVEVTYSHFEEIKKLLNENQLPEFEGFMKIITDRLLSGKKKNHPPPKDFE